MSKTNLLLLFVESLLIFGVNACQREPQNWNLLLSARGYPEIVYDNNSDSLWVFDETKKTIGYIVNDGNGNNSVIQNIPYPGMLDLQNSILDFCASEDVWVVTDNGKLLLYDPQYRNWVENSSMSDKDRVRSCEPLNSKTIAIVAGKNRVAIVNHEDVYWLPDVPGKIRNLRQDDFGNIWALSENEPENIHVVYREENRSQWSEQSREPGGRLLSVKNSSIWTAGTLAGNPLVTVFESTIGSGLSATTSPLSQIQINGVLVDLFSDKNFNVWLVTDSSIMLRKAGSKEFSVVPLPWNVDNIISSAFDVKKCILYISTDTGVFYNKNNSCQTK